MISIFTITARNYLSLALTLGESVSKYHPEATFSIFVADGLSGLDLNQIPFDLVDVPQLLGAQITDDLAFKYNITEFCTSFKPSIFKYILENIPEVDLVYYLDPDIQLFSRLDSLTVDTPDKTIYLCPHLIDCKVEDDQPYPEYKHLWEGIFNLGFCAIRRTPSSKMLIEWWDARLRQYCYADFLDGLHTDQKWMDYIPAFFPRDHVVVTNFGANAAHWNLGERIITEMDGEYFVNGFPLVFFHFSGFDFAGTLLTRRHPKNRQVAVEGALASIVKKYREEVYAHGYSEYINIKYNFGYFSDGVPITSMHRRLYRVLSRKSKVASPFDAFSGFRGMLKEAGLLDLSHAATRNYSAETVKGLDGIRSRVQWALTWFLRLFGIRRYVYLIKLFSQYGRIENHEFLLEQHMRPRV